MSNAMLHLVNAKDKELEAAKQRIADLEAQIELYARLLPSWKPMGNAPIDRRILLLHSTGNGQMAVDIGQWNDQRFHRAPKPYWEYCSGVTQVHYARTFPPVGWMDLPQ